eukprot:Gregarina_sp_Poly_1__3747@NODE_210_length_11350_cov_52_014358_g187_i0_p3_GENE_NODE_210_length_11350_cov_52_014358_g187_i0NODE_210_length_11350_cov_52_014358_g187_i0_p3_ORF_typecomplete_len713_score95_37Hexokinase_1/PF00349_21/6_7e27Hexokinase_2/PF03727_16/1_3e26_NODE_210_length_11350_cov_52_014358_g187_i068899027
MTPNSRDWRADLICLHSNRNGRNSSENPIFNPPLKLRESCCLCPQKPLMVYNEYFRPLRLLHSPPQVSGLILGQPSLASTPGSGRRRLAAASSRGNIKVKSSPRSPRSDNRPVLLIDDEANRQEFMEFIHYFLSEDYDEQVARKILQPFRDKLALGRVPLLERANILLAAMNMNMRTFHSLVNVFQDEMSRGLQANLQYPGFWYPRLSSFKMIDTYLQKLPNGDEKGIAYAVHINGQRVRVTRFKMPGDASSAAGGDVANNCYSLKATGLADPRVSRTQFFDAIVELLQMSMYKHGDLELYFNYVKLCRSPKYGTPRKFSLYPIALSVTFPVIQRSADSAILVEWTGDMAAGRATPQDPIEGTDIVEGFNAALVRCTTPGRVVVYTNETVGCLYSAAYDYARQPSGKKEHRRLLLGVVCGVGLDACYVEANAKAHYGYEGSVIDLECGNLDRDLPLTIVDYELDGVVPESQGQNLLEKMTALRYIGEIARRLTTHIFQNKTPPKAWEEGTLSPAQVISIAEDTSVTKDLTHSVIRECWNRLPLFGDEHDMLKSLHPQSGNSLMDRYRGLSPSTVSEVDIVFRCCRATIDRAAALTAVVALGIAKQSGYLKPSKPARFRRGPSGGFPTLRRLGLAVGGQFMESSDLFKDRLRYWLSQGMRSVSIESGGVDLLQAKDGTGRGLAIVAAVVASSGDSAEFGPSETYQMSPISRYI